MKKIIVLFTFVLAGFAHSSFAAINATAICKIEKSDLTEIYQFVLDSKPHVIIQTEKSGEVVSEEKLVVSFRESLWVGAYMGAFQRNGFVIHFTILNYQSPSIGRMSFEMQSEDMACELPGFNDKESVFDALSIASSNECFGDADCPSGYKCKINWSTDPFICVPMTKSEPKKSDGCYSDADCPHGYFCKINWSEGPYSCRPRPQPQHPK